VTSSPPPEDLITPRQAAKLLHCHIATVYRYVLQGKLPCWRRAQCHHLVSRRDVLALFEPVVVERVALPPTKRAVEARRRHTNEVLRRAGFKGFGEDQEDLGQKPTDSR
jgi:excisionase family DNA binding protein